MKKVYCIKEFRSSCFYFLPGTYYEIYYINGNDIWIFIDNEKNIVQRFIFNSEREDIIFSDYFLTINELRKNKILKINSL